MRSIWYEFIDDFGNEIPYKPLSVILEAFYWFCQAAGTIDEVYKMSCHEKVGNLMKK